MPSRQAGRRAPRRWADKPGKADPAWLAVWRGLQQAYVPDATGATASQASRRMVELVHGAPTTQGSSANYGGEGQAGGPALSVSGSPLVGIYSLHSQLWGPAVGAAFSVFAFVVRRDTSATIQALIGNGFSGSGGWTFQANYGASGSGRLGLTRWGVGDDITTSTLGAVPNDGLTASGIGVAYAAGGPARFFLNGRFEELASGSMTGAGIGDFVIGRTSSGGLQGMAIQVIYMWDRVLTDGEFQRLYRDPYGPIRPRRAPAFTAASVPAALRATQVVAEIMAQPIPALRVSQVAIEVMISQAVGVTAELRVTSALAEVLTLPTPSLRATMVVAEALVAATPAIRATQAAIEALVLPTPALLVTQVALEVLVKPSVTALTYKGQLWPRGAGSPLTPA